MGLDMYLYKKSFVKNWNHTPDAERFQISIKRNKKAFNSIKKDRICFITEEVAYWRKFNALHAWFVQECQKGVDDCQESHVPINKIKELLPVLEDILKGKCKPDSGLPTQSGFFFGSTDYDDYYFEDVKYTIKVFKAIIKEFENAKANGVYSDLYYHSSW